MLDERDIGTLSIQTNPVWVYDVEEYRICWANQAAVELWEAASLEALLRRDFKPTMSDAIFELLKDNLKQYQQGKEHTQWWTLYPQEVQKEVYCHISGIRLEDQRVAMVVQVISGQPVLGSELSESPSTITASLWDKHGYLKSANPLFLEAYGGGLTHFNELFYSTEEAQRLWKRALNEREYETELYLPTPSGKQAHYLQLRVNQSKAGNLMVLRQFIKYEEAADKHVCSAEGAPHLPHRQQQMRQLIPQAMGSGEFCVEYQSVKQAKEHRLYAVEALVKWQSPQLGVVSVEEFMPIADDYGIASLLGYYVLEKACKQVMEWGLQGKPLVKLIMTLSPLQVMTPNYLNAIEILLKKTGFPASELIIHIKGEELMTRSPILIEIVKSLRLMGIMIASDAVAHFGQDNQGHRIDVLADVPLTHVKLSPSMNTSTSTRVLMEQAAREAHQCGLQIIASNITANWQLNLMALVGCGLYQGALAGLVSEKQGA